MIALAAYFDLVCGLWIPAAVAWDAETGECREVEGPLGFPADGPRGEPAPRGMPLDSDPGIKLKFK